MHEVGKALHTDGRWFRDREGRVAILRGINCGGDSKVPPFEPFATEASAAQIAGFGFDVVRYCAVWEGAEPDEGRYTDAYLDRMVEIVGWLTARGVHVFIDMHQDLFSRRLRGSGAPAWATAGDPAKLPFPDGGPRWFLNYPSAPVADAFDRFWGDAALQAHFLEALVRIARRFASNPLVIGYEVLNEPWHGRLGVFDGEFERKVLAPFYERAIAAVRAVDENALVFLEPALACGGLIAAQSRLPATIATGRPGLVYAPHYYPLGALTGEEPDVDVAIASIDADLALVDEKASELGVPALLGEFGVHPRQPDGARFLRGYYEMLDRHRMGGTVWTYAPRDREWNDEGMSLVGPSLEERPYVDVVVRPYAAAIAGLPSGMRFDAATRRFSLDVDGVPVDAETIVRVPARVYPNGADVRVSVGRAEHDAAAGVVRWDARGEWGRRSIEIAAR